MEDHLGGGRKGGWQPDERSGRAQFVAGIKGNSKRGKGWACGSTEMGS